MKPNNLLPFLSFWAFPIRIKVVLQFTFLSTLIILFIWGCNNPNDPLDPTDPPEPPIEKGIFECTDTILTTCPLVGQWTFINSGCVPVNDYKGSVTGGLAHHGNSIVFNSDGKVFFTYLDGSELWGNWSDLTKYYDMVDCQYINIRSQENEIIDQIEIIELTENRLRLRNDTWCGAEDCLFIRTPKPYHDDENNIALNEEICKLHKCQTCGNNNAGYECSISYSYIDIAGDLNYVSSQKSGNKIVICTKEYLICLKDNLEILWKYTIDFDLGISSNGYSYDYKPINNFTVDNEGNIYIFYYTENTQSNHAFEDIPHMRKFDINGNQKFHMQYNYESFKRDIDLNIKHEIKYFNNNLYFVHSGLFAKFDLDGNLLTLKQMGGPHREKIFPVDDRIYIGVGETIDFGLTTISPVNYQYSPILNSNNYSAQAIRIFTLGNNLFLAGDYTRLTEHSVWGYHVPGIIVQDDEVVDIVRSFNFEYDCTWGVVPISDTSIVSYVCDDYFELIKQIDGKFRPIFRYKNDINSSDYYDDFRFQDAYQIGNKIFLLGTGKRFTKTILGVTIDLDKLYPAISCE